MITAVEILYIFCVLVMCILLLGIHITERKISSTSASFRKVIYAATFLLVTSMMTELLDENVQLTPVAFVVNELNFLSVDIMMLAFAEYLRIFLEPYENKKTAGLKVVVATTIVRVLSIIGLTAAGSLFTIENGCYVEGSLISVPYIISCIVIMELIYVVIRNRQCLQKRDMAVMIIYLILPVIPILLEMLFSLYVVVELAVTLSVLMVYVLVQAVMMEQGKYREDILEEASTQDFLTRLKNRRAMYRDIDGVDEKESIGVLFCDLNGLKRTNDNYGHEAGDALIRRFADIAAAFWEKENVYRISGDEFIVLIRDHNIYDFREQTEKFDMIIGCNEDIASYGSAYGTVANIEKLIREAEDNMYSFKKAYYRKNNGSR